MGITTDKQKDDNTGSTESFSGTATTTFANVPASAGNKIDGAGVWNDSTTIDLQISFDAGTTFFDLPKKSFIGQNIQGNITQIQVKTPSSTADYRMIVNFKDT